MDEERTLAPHCLAHKFTQGPEVIQDVFQSGFAVARPYFWVNTQPIHFAWCIARSKFVCPDFGEGVPNRCHLSTPKTVDPVQERVTDVGPTRDQKPKRAAGQLIGGSTPRPTRHP